MGTHAGLRAIQMQDLLKYSLHALKQVMKNSIPSFRPLDIPTSYRAFTVVKNEKKKKKKENHRNYVQSPFFCFWEKFKICDSEILFRRHVRPD